MGRSIAGAVVGYVVDFFVVLGVLTAAWYAVGIGGVFQPGVWEVTALWILLMLAASFVAGLAGGKVARKIDASGLGVKILAGLIVGLGIVFELPGLLGSAPLPVLPRPDTVPMFDAMGSGQQPVWSTLLYLLLGATGAVLGGRGGRGGREGQKTA